MPEATAGRLRQATGIPKSLIGGAQRHRVAGGGQL
jgi:hypothetical protein